MSIINTGGIEEAFVGFNQAAHQWIIIFETFMRALRYKKWTVS